MQRVFGVALTDGGHEGHVGVLRDVAAVPVWGPLMVPVWEQHSFGLFSTGVSELLNFSSKHIQSFTKRHVLVCKI